ncbi:tyrosine-type recombinase/integrase [Gymnodinialimonas ceratoperidinii]|nr:integrase arm-type DNA-binding domain-containing protein [Gymnodinialimonas ceratoperidinii]
MPLSDAKIRILKPKAKPYKVGDQDGLYITVTPSVSRLWHLKYRIDGREKRLSFGAYPSVGLATARKLKDQARSTLADGSDPGAVKQEQKRVDREIRGNTFAAQAKAFIDKGRREGKADATKAKIEWLLGMACADFGALPITAITSPTVLACLRKVEAKGNYETAKRLRAKIGGVSLLVRSVGSTGWGLGTGWVDVVESVRNSKDGDGTMSERVRSNRSSRRLSQHPSRS